MRGRVNLLGVVMVEVNLAHESKGRKCKLRENLLKSLLAPLSGGLPLRKETFAFRIMVKGQSVVCINDKFSELIRALYKQLPTEGETYTIREVFLGREKVVKGCLLYTSPSPRDRG